MCSSHKNVRPCVTPGPPDKASACVSPAVYCNLLAGFTTDYDKSSNKLFERHLHAECRSFLYPHSDPVGWANDSANRLLQFHRGILRNDGNAIDVHLALAGVDSRRSYNLDATGNWVDGGFSGSGPAVESTHDCHSDQQARTANSLNQIATIDGNPLKYDLTGNLLGYKGLAFTFDGFKRLIRAFGTGPDGTPTDARYYYDALRRRMRKTVNGTVMDFVPLGTQVLEERDGGSNLLRQFVWGQYVDELIQQREFQNPPPGQASVDWYPLTDLLHRSVALTDDSVCQDTGGTGGSSAGPFKPSFVEVYDTDVYGRTNIYSDPGPDGVWFSEDDTPTFHPKCRRIYTGREYEPETGLHFFNARYYHPDLGRFLSRDPIFYQGGMNLYAYCGGMPGTNTDPTGNDGFDPMRPIPDQADDWQTHWARRRADPMKLAQADFAHWMPLVGQSQDAVDRIDREIASELTNKGPMRELNLSFLRWERGVAAHDLEITSKNFYGAAHRISGIQRAQLQEAMEGIETRVGWLRMVPGGNTAYYLAEDSFGKAALWFGVDVVLVVPWSRAASPLGQAFHVTQESGGFSGRVLRAGAGGRIWATAWRPGLWATEGGFSNAVKRTIYFGSPWRVTEVMEMTGQARALFSPVTGWGPLTAWKSFSGQLVTRAPGGLLFEASGQLMKPTGGELLKYWGSYAVTPGLEVLGRGAVYYWSREGD